MKETKMIEYEQCWMSVHQAVMLGDKCSADFVMPQFDSAVELSWLNSAL
jgi:hypothetical protein